MSLIKENPSIISKNVVINGNLKTQNGNIEIEGEIIGDIDADTITLRENGKIQGNIKSKILNIKGIFQGKAIAEKINISENAKVNGELEYGALAVDYGANVNCQLKRNDGIKNAIKKDILEEEDNKKESPSVGGFLSKAKPI